MAHSASSSPLSSTSGISDTPPAPRALHPLPNQIAWKKDLLRLRGPLVLRVSAQVEATLGSQMEETWQQFTLGFSEITVVPENAFRSYQFSLSAPGASIPAPLPLIMGATYSLHAGAGGISGLAQDGGSFRHAWFTFLQLILPTREAQSDWEFSVPHVDIHDWPTLGFRGVHLCVFPETTRLGLEKAIRLAAFLKFTHVVVEFWGTLRLDALRELSWPDAWSKAEAAELLGLARSLGLEVVPMYNCWGHAAASRIRYGRHVVLDQNPSLAPLFEPDGWTWCLTNPDAQTLIRKICSELMDLAGPGQYFHIGCDEAYSHGTCDRCRDHDAIELFSDHINQLTDFIQNKGRRPIMWGDALLERAQWPLPLEANGLSSLPTHLSLKHLSRKITIADWHYDVKEGPLRTGAYFRREGFEVIACPWHDRQNIKLHAESARENQGGLLFTTWDRLSDCIPQLVWAANCAWTESLAHLERPECSWSLLRCSAATYLRRLMPAGGSFERAGWSPSELSPDSL